MTDEIKQLQAANEELQRQVDSWKALAETNAAKALELLGVIDELRGQLNDGESADFWYKMFSNRFGGNEK